MHLGAELGGAKEGPAAERVRHSVAAHLEWRRRGAVRCLYVSPLSCPVQTALMTVTVAALDRVALIEEKAE